MSGNADKKLLVSKIVVQKKRADCRSSKLWHNFVVPAFFDNHRCSSSIAQTVAQTAKPCCAGVFRIFSMLRGGWQQLAQHFSSLIYMTYMHMKGYIFIFLAYVRVKKVVLLCQSSWNPENMREKGGTTFFQCCATLFLNRPRTPRNCGNVWHNKVVPKVVTCKNHRNACPPTVYSESNSASSEARLLVVLPHPLQNALKPF